MKIKQLHIDSFRQLENLQFDFTYPEGHELAGQPLKKICIVGQSATGKTTVLELIKNSFEMLDDIDVIEKSYLHYKNRNRDIVDYQLNFAGSVEYSNADTSFRLETDSIVTENQRFLGVGDGGGKIERLIKDKLSLLYFSSEIIAKEVVAILNINPIDILNSISKEQRNIRGLRLGNYVCEFLENTSKDIWISLLSKILEYRKRFTQMAAELINKGAIGDFKKLNREYEKWAAENENPLISFAEYFNPIMGKLNLEVDLINTEYSIPIRSKITDEVVPISALSTGTKSLLLSMFPLFELDTQESIILIDEPERSLFPDIQIDLMGHYQRIAPDAQFIIATHSPFIAAAFEPEERFILYFDDQGKVAVRRGESPIGDDPNDILSNDFHVDYYNEFGKAAHRKYVSLKQKLSQEQEQERKKELLVELAELGDKYNF